jgi:hypothetical protein
LATEVAPEGRGGAATSTCVDEDGATQVALAAAGLLDAISIANLIAAQFGARGRT